MGGWGSRARKGPGLDRDHRSPGGRLKVARLEVGEGLTGQVVGWSSSGSRLGSWATRGRLQFSLSTSSSRSLSTCSMLSPCWCPDCVKILFHDHKNYRYDNMKNSATFHTIIKILFSSCQLFVLHVILVVDNYSFVFVND